MTRLDGVLNEIVGFKCEGQIQEFYLSIFDSRARRSQTNVGLALLTVNWETGVSQVEYLIGENLPRFALSRLGNNWLAAYPRMLENLVCCPIQRYVSSA